MSDQADTEQGTGDELLAYIKQRDDQRKKSRNNWIVAGFLALVVGVTAWGYFDGQREKEQLHNERVEMFRDALGG